MSNERAILCGEVADTGLPIDGTPLRLRLWGGHQNVTLAISDISTPMMNNVPDAFLDLLEIATYVYCADQAITRGGDGVERFGADWRRRLFFRIPVRELDLWSSKEAQSALLSTLRFLSEDDYEIEFTKLKDGPSVQQYLFTGDNSGPQKVEEVALFSGGLDSLGGAIKEAVVDKRHVALVTHQPSRKLVRRYGKLTSTLRERSAAAPMFVPVTVNKKKILGREYTQRSRSFLYMALGATVAQMLGLARIRFYENGIISLNFPPTAQVVGARATRTTHPRVINGYAEILSLVANRRFEVENPFMWMTKAEVVSQIVEAGCADLIGFSTSCTHTWDMTNLHPHCGACSQCIDRRFAVLAAGAGDSDPEEGYKVKLLVDARDDGEPRTMVAAYVETANQVASMTPLEFFARFGEISRVLRHINGSPDATALRIYELHRRHAEQVTGVVDAAIAAHARQIRERILPPSCLLRLVCDSAAAGDERSEVAKAADETSKLPDFAFKRNGQAWSVRYAGGEAFTLLPSKGAAYLQVLLSKRGTAFPVEKLAAVVARQPAEYLLGDAGERSDAEALSAYRARYEQLKDELEDAQERHDVDAEERARVEMDDLQSQIRKDQGLGGRLRKDADDRERVRKAVQAAIRRTIKEIRKYDKRLAEHLKSPTLKCGWQPCYEPNEPVEWAT